MWRVGAGAEGGGEAGTNEEEESLREGLDRNGGGGEGGGAKDGRRERESVRAGLEGVMSRDRPTPVYTAIRLLGTRSRRLIVTAIRLLGTGSRLIVTLTAIRLLGTY